MKRRTDTLADVGEHAFLRALQRALAGRRPRLVCPQGPGDDAALVSMSQGEPTTSGARGADAVVCTDMVVEDVDFRRRWATFADVGHKAAAINLSDLAAMGARPVSLFASIAAQPSERAGEMMRLCLALDACARRFGAALCGGDLSRTRGPLVVSVTAVGRAPRRPLLRHRADVGDVVCVTGPLGAARSGLALLESPAVGVGAGLGLRLKRALWAAQRRPLPHVDAGEWLAGVPGITAGCDVSDGLLADAAHLPRAGCGVVLDAMRLPIAAGVERVASAVAPGGARALALQWALCGGEEFVLVVGVKEALLHCVLAAAGRRRQALVPVGRIVAMPGVRVWPSPSAGEGPFDHFVAPRAGRQRGPTGRR